MKQTIKSNKLYIVGFMGAGKSTVGKLLADRLNLKFYDLDTEIEKTEGIKISAIFQEKGEEYFRKLESKILNNISNKNGNWVISTGGGVVLSNENWSSMASKGVVIYLKADISCLWGRVRSSTTKRPLLNVDNAYDRAKELFSEREKLYEKADYIVNTDNLNKDQVVDKIVKLLS